VACASKRTTEEPSDKDSGGRNSAVDLSVPRRTRMVWRWTRWQPSTNRERVINSLPMFRHRSGSQALQAISHSRIIRHLLKHSLDFSRGAARGNGKSAVNDSREYFPTEPRGSALGDLTRLPTHACTQPCMQAGTRTRTRTNTRPAAPRPAPHMHPHLRPLSRRRLPLPLPLIVASRTSRIPPRQQRQPARHGIVKRRYRERSARPIHASG
jgi:hypothetical protein